MLNSLNTGLTGLQTSQERMGVIGDNIANVNTTAFKASRLTFEESFSQTLQAAFAGGAGGGGRSAVQVGSGVRSGATTTLFSPSVMATGGNDTDLYIDGTGFFVVKDASGAEFATRAGEFHTDETTGYMVTNHGQRLQGYSNGELSQKGDIKIDATGRPQTAQSDTVTKVNIRGNGEVWVTLADNTEFRRGQVLLTSFQNPSALKRVGGNLYAGLDSAGRTAATTPGTNGLGEIVPGGLEMSNVDLARQFADLITTQRGFQANARIVSASDELLQEMVNLKR